MSQITGFYGGKFMPLHKGHLYCIDVSARQCDKVVIIMFINGDEELEILKTHDEEELTVEYRIKQLEKVCKLYDNVSFYIIDDTFCRNDKGENIWDMETPLVREHVPVMDYVYSSEPQYGDYFKRAYPEATHVIVDEKRVHYPISGTMIRAMELLEEKKLWIV
ncbi:MAG: adenylyltransferase/cytidyltransferase family protein [Lachnospiraceae bacterium]|nr:adenylyltransferase/cytidyltransferase family protein [Lachnospiraceae bacterium]